MSTSWIQTFTGKTFFPLNPRSEDVCIEDIAHALSQMCRYGGHSKKFYSVAEHSIYVAMLAPPPAKKHGLLHDAAEAYSADILNPIKEYFVEFKKTERQLEKIIFRAFGMAEEIPAEVKEIDRRMCATEQPFMFDTQLEWPLIKGVEPFKAIKPGFYTPQLAEGMFLRMWKRLNSEDKS